MANCISNEGKDSMERPIPEDDIVNFIFPQDLSGIYCSKRSDKGTILYAYLPTSLEFVIIINDLTQKDYKKHSWQDYIAGCVDCGRIQLIKFLEELSSRAIMKKGNEYDKRQAESYWEVYSPQVKAPADLISFINHTMENE